MPSRGSNLSHNSIFNEQWVIFHPKSASFPHSGGQKTSAPIIHAASRHLRYFIYRWTTLPGSLSVVNSFFKLLFRCPRSTAICYPKNAITLTTSPHLRNTFFHLFYTFFKNLCFWANSSRKINLNLIPFQPSSTSPPHFLNRLKQIITETFPYVAANDLCLGNPIPNWFLRSATISTSIA